MKKVLSIFVSTLVVMMVEAYPGRLYMIGDAAPNGWSLDNASLMQQESDGVFKWVGDLTTGSLKFITNMDWVPSYGPSENGVALSIGEQNLSYRSTYEDSDNAFAVTAGRYAIRIDLTGSAAVISVADGTGMEDVEVSNYYPEAIYPIGDATAAGWIPADAIRMDETAFNSGVYSATLELQNGELKFLHKRDWGNAYGAMSSSVSVTGPGDYSIVLLDDADNKFNVVLNAAQTFDITVDVPNGSMRLSQNSGTAVPEVLFDRFPQGVYSIQGLRVAESIENLPMGIYVVRDAEGVHKIIR